MKNYDFMQEAIKEAKLGISSKDGGPFGCVIVKDNNIIGRGHNCVIKLNDPTSHGEIMAIRDACKNISSFDLKDCVLYTTGYPCPMCLCAILWANISNVYYACDSNDIDDIGFRDKQFYENKQHLSLKQLSRDECLEVFEEYKKGDHKKY